MRDTSSATPDAALTPLPLQALRLVRFALHLLRGVATIALVYPLASEVHRLSLRQSWSARLLDILAIRIAASGVPLQPACLLVANHISWIDVFVINALRPSCFVSKDDVRHWPLIGWLAARNGTLFLRRGSRRQAHAMSEAVGTVLRAGGNVAVFPEGTTTEGRSVRHFHAALLQPAIDAACPVQPLALRYVTPDGAYCAAPAYVGETSLWQCLKAIVSRHEIVAAVNVMPPITTAELPRRSLAEATRRPIAAQVEADYADDAECANDVATDAAAYERAPAEAGA